MLANNLRSIARSRVFITATVAASVWGCGADANSTATGDDAPRAGSTAAAELDRDLSLGSAGPDVRFVNDYLSAYGYLPNTKLQQAYPAWRPPVQTAPSAPDVYDEATASGLRALQANFGLPVTGTADAATRLLLSAPRCARPDNIPRPDRSDKYDVTRGGWGTKTNLTVKVTNAPSGISLTSVRSAVMAAVNSWATFTDFTFTQVTSGTADITVNFANNVWCAGGAINAYAKATGPGPGACLTFNTDPNQVPPPNWSVATPVPATSLDIQALATHELGHTLGFGHSGYSNAIMYPSVPFGSRPPLSNDDVNAAYALAKSWFFFDSDGENDLDIDDGSLFYTRYVTALPVLQSGELSVWSATNGGSWVNMSGSGSGAIGGSRISSNTIGTWIVQSNGDIYSFNSGTSWTKRPGCAKDIAIGPDNSIWVLGCAANSSGDFPLYKWNGSGWTHDATNGAGLRISVGKRLDTGAIVPWVVNAGGGIFRRSANNTSSSATWQQLPGAGKDIAANASGYSWLIGTSPTAGGFTIFGWNEQPAVNIGGPPPVAKFEWDMVPGGATNVATSSNGTPSVTNDRGEFFEF